MAQLPVGLVARGSRQGPSRELQGSVGILQIHWRTKHVVNLIFETNGAETLAPAMC